ncbi:LysR family transcriptional regulator [Devosia sp. BK]|uniref:LysR family transcriptional regulator n=1 Tax=unclassified Devosia TaxID=196773 RepID=UPI000714FFBF|nr:MULTISPECIES: LysR family transcriptional regulator [unclassified Devosia]KQN74924.1 LysR family transcriptional regulator [Devosia sp. Leaf64]KQT42760.1 LysR family transcriptional regulator [Devosia sp. Leaf420]MDV3253273.1 LysR family transcriptional regulator [Devosia sp. BK]
MNHLLADFDIGLLLTFDAMLRDRNVTHAAARLNITQSALSARLTRLRQLLGDPLFIPSNSGRGMVASPHALALAPDLASLLEQLSDFIGTARVFDPSVSRRIFRVAATDNPVSILAPDLIPLIRSAAPDARIAFTVPNKARIAEDLEQGEVDVFIGVNEDAAPGLMARKLFEEAFVTAYRHGHPRNPGPMTLDEFCALDHLLISTSGGHFSGMIDQALTELGRARRVSVSVQSYALAPLMLASTDLICTLPRRFLQRFESMLEIIETPLDLAPFEMTMFWHPRMNADAAHVWLRQQILSTARAGLWP